MELTHKEIHLLARLSEIDNDFTTRNAPVTSATATAAPPVYPAMIGLDRSG
jgi:hypothetical protein